ncbi:putative carboxyphosphonoenolpyruvate phosphonomutase [Microthyrium microscopicum]|uniref:Putative carboxyphosphonoenolpyruvate phosphonomutase n=1 Tax=Microthyrium microscopicum TaxID=703497 RepID=A0A6A6UTR7_9PEZI|nr:putative carboxyphosphonoenolpyruvate phosphonomutase [Microthyrium microscopicum]
MTTNNTSPPIHPATKLRRIIEDPNGFVFAPGVHDGLSARVALASGFDVLYMTGAGTAASRLGQPDIALTTLPDMRAHAEMIASLSPTTPLIADMDTGFGGPSNVHRSVLEYIRAGVAGAHIEDQTQQKRCGHLSNKQLVSMDVFVSRIRAAVAARKSVGSDFVVIARTDALAGEGGYEEALRRLKGARGAGADVAFLEGVPDKETMGRVIRDLEGWPVLLNMVEYGRTPTVSVEEARALGFRVMIWPFAGIAPAMVAMKTAYKELKSTGLMKGQEKVTPKDLFGMCGLDEWVKVDMAAGGEDFRNGV